MSEHRVLLENRTFGLYLRRIREDRRLSLDTVEELSVGYPEPVTKSHLSRIENGRAVPTFPRMFALCQIYGVPISSMAERFEIDLRREASPEFEFDKEHLATLVTRMERLRDKGRYDRILQLTTSALDQLDAADAEDHDENFRWRLSNWQLGALRKLGHYESCKIRCEELLGLIPEDSEFHVQTLVSFVICSYRMRRFTVAVMGLERLENVITTRNWPADLRALARSTRGEVYHTLGDYPKARTSFESSLAAQLELGNEYAACMTRINLGQVLIDMKRPGAAKRYLVRSLRDATEHGYDRLLALANGHLAVLHFRAEEFAAAEPYALRSNAIARSLKYPALLFRNSYYLWKLAMRRDDEAATRSHERTLSALVHRVPHDLPEADEYRSFVRGDDQ